MPRPILHSFPVVLLLTALTVGLVWFVYLHQMLRPWLRQRGQAFPSVAFWVMVVASITGEALRWQASRGAAALELAGLGLNALGMGAAILFFVLVIRRGGLHPGAWTFPAMHAAALVGLALTADGRTSAVGQALGDAVAIPAVIVLVVAWYWMHRHLVADRHEGPRAATA